METIRVSELRENPLMMVDTIMEMIEPMGFDMAIALIHIIIDQLCANADMTSKDTIELYEHMCRAAKEAQELFGMPEKRV